jgi:hypothetical protein
MFKNKKFTVLFFLFVISGLSYAECIPVAGLQFERISDIEIIASKNGKNFAVLTVSVIDSRYEPRGPLPKKIGVFRFFSEELCTKGAESRFHIDGQLFYLNGVTLFKQ